MPVEGIEPPWLACKTSVLPLNYTGLLVRDPLSRTVTSTIHSNLQSALFV